MREQELIVYRTFQDGELLADMAWLMAHYEEAGRGEALAAGRICTVEAVRALFYDCIHRLIERAPMASTAICGTATWPICW